MFIGLLIGTLCLIGLVRAVFWRRRGFYHYPGWAYRYGPGGHGAGGYGRWGHGMRRGGRGVLFSVLDRLDATPAQEKAISGALDELRETAFDLRGTLKDARHRVAEAVRSPAFDTSAFAAGAAGVDEATSRIRSALAAALEKVHAVLDDRQRNVLGELIESSHARGC